MAMGKKRTERQEEMWVVAADLPQGPGHPFYRRLNQLLDEHGFDGFVEGLCRKFYHGSLGRPRVPPGVYFRMLLIGYFEGIDGERGIAWRCADSLALRMFLGRRLTEDAPDHSSLSVIRNRIDLETHQEVFTWVLKLLAAEGLLKGKSIGVDATTLEADAAMRSIVRKDTGTVTTSSCRSWPRPAASARRRGRTWPSWTAGGRTRPATRTGRTRTIRTRRSRR